MTSYVLFVASKFVDEGCTRSLSNRPAGVRRQMIKRQRMCKHDVVCISGLPSICYLTTKYDGGVINSTCKVLRCAELSALYYSRKY